jgi:hypothetical protein
MVEGTLAGGSVPFAAIADPVELPYRPASVVNIIDDVSADVILNHEGRRRAGPRPCSSLFVDRENNLGKGRSAHYNRCQSVAVRDEYPGGSWEPRRAVRSSRLTRMEQALWAARPGCPTVR